MIQDIHQAFAQIDGFKDLATVNDVWLIHFTSDEAARSIEAHGFTKGSPLDGLLAHTFGANSKNPGVNFAFATSDEYSIMTLAEYDFGTDTESAVVFKASGVKMTHYDMFSQVAFWGPDAKGPFHRLVCITPIDERDDLEPHAMRWTVAATDQEGDLFDVIDLVEAAAETPKPRGYKPG